MSESEETFYTADRWQNWLDRVGEEDLDPENEDSARLLLNLQDDTAIAVAKIVSAYDDDRLSEEEAIDEIADVREIVLAEVEMDSEEKVMLIDGVQTSLVCVFYSAEEYMLSGAVEEGSVAEFVDAAAAAEADDDVDAALGYLVQAGTKIIDGEELPMDAVEDLEYGLVSEWVNGLDSLQSAMADPEVVEEDE
ncbi:DUF2150 family protein [Halobaculum lipolyticum]|uniref:DUF2150 family protein n=1 Tax=Halobaculum lipolyticum TaxID=3032001 RepID=A0ABD5W852_9EURY|nr:DUF2150 family protein [Halobaculum sp. DT31]